MPAICSIIDTEDWNQIDDSKCSLFKSTKHLSPNQVIHLLENYFFQQIKKMKQKELLMKHTAEICQFFDAENMNGRKFVAMNKKEFVNGLKAFCNNKGLHAALTKLHKVMTDCDLNIMSHLQSECLC